MTDKERKVAEEYVLLTDKDKNFVREQLSGPVSLLRVLHMKIILTIMDNWRKLSSLFIEDEIMYIYSNVYGLIVPEMVL